MKKILSIIGIALVIVALGLMSYYYFVFNKVDPATGQKETFRQFLPFGSPSTSKPPQNQTVAGTDGGIAPLPVVLPALQQIAAGPVAGSMILEAPYSSSTVARYIDRATGNIYDYALASGTTDRITNTTMPKIVESLWSTDGKSVIMRFLGEGSEFISSYYAQLQNSTSTAGLTELSGSYLPTSIDSMTPLGASGKIFSLMSGPDGSTGYVSAMNGSGRIMVFKSPIQEWNAQGITPTTVALTTKAAGYTPGFLYMLNTTSSSLTKVLGNVFGLTTLVSPNDQYALIGENNNGYTLKLLDIKNKTVKPLTLATVPEKCTWAADSSYAFCGVSVQKLDVDFLDLWYQGIVSTTDDLWVINPSDTSVSVLTKASDKNIDAIHLSIDKNERYLTFMNKKDLSLWVYRLPVPQAAQASTTTASSTIY